MQASGTVTSVRRRVMDHGSVYLTVVLDARAAFKYLHTYSHLPAEGDKVEITGTPVIGSRKVNLGGVTVTKIAA